MQNQKDERKPARYAKDLALQRAEAQVHRSVGGDTALSKYRTKNIERTGVPDGDHKPPPSEKGKAPPPGPVTKSMHMPGPIMGENLHRYMMMHGIDAAQYMGKSGSEWEAVKTPLEGRDTMTSDIKIGDHDEDDYDNNDEKSINDKGKRSKRY